MTALDQLFQDPPETTSGCYYAQLTDVRPCTGARGRYVKLFCLDDHDIPIEATADHRHFHLLEPYFNELRIQRQDPDAEWPVVPLFQGNDGRWRFSWHAASRDNPNLSAASAAPEPCDRAYRMQVSVPGELASRFKQIAQARGVSHTDLLLSLIRDAIT